MLPLKSIHKKPGDAFFPTICLSWPILIRSPVAYLNTRCTQGLHVPQRWVGTAQTFPALDSCFIKQPVQSMPGTGLCDWAQTVGLFDALPLISVCDLIWLCVCARKCQMTAGCEQRQINRTQYGQLADGHVYERVHGRPFAGCYSGVRCNVSTHNLRCCS